MKGTVTLCSGLEVDIDYEVSPPDRDQGEVCSAVLPDSIRIYRPQKDGRLKEVHPDAYWILGETLDSIAETLTDNIDPLGED